MQRNSRELPERMRERGPDNIRENEHGGQHREKSNFVRPYVCDKNCNTGPALKMIKNHRISLEQMEGLECEQKKRGRAAAADEPRLHGVAAERLYRLPETAQFSSNR